jgi:hypothetical protein
MLLPAMPTAGAGIVPAKMVTGLLVVVATGNPDWVTVVVTVIAFDKSVDNGV